MGWKNRWWKHLRLKHRGAKEPGFFNPVIVCLVLWLLIQNLAYAAKPEYDTKTLPNGTQVIYKVLPQAKTVTVRIAFQAGLLTEPNSLRGISHLMERLIHRGNQRITAEQFRSLVDYQGGSYYSFTTFNRTEYCLEVLPKDLLPALVALRELLMQPEFAEPAIALEKKILTVENAMPATPDNTFFRNLNQLSEKQLQDSLQGIHRDDLLQYHQRLYRPDLCKVIITGAFNPAEVFKLFAVSPAPVGKPAMEVLPLPLQEAMSDTVLNDYLPGEQYQLLNSFELRELSGKELLVAKALPYILNYVTHQYDHLTDRPLDYRIFLLNLSNRYFLIFQYRDCFVKYSPQIEQWHQKNLERYFKYLNSTNFSPFLNSLAGGYDKYFGILGDNAADLNEYYDQILFEPTGISYQDAAALRRLTPNDFKIFVRKYLQGQKSHKIVINAL